MRKTINKLFLIITVISALLLTTGCDLFIKTNKGQVDQKWYMGLTYEDDNGNDTDYTIETDGTIAAVALEDGYGDEFGIIKGEEAYLNINTIIKNMPPSRRNCVTQTALWCGNPRNAPTKPSPSIPAR